MSRLGATELPCVRKGVGKIEINRHQWGDNSKTIGWIGAVHSLDGKGKKRYASQIWEVLKKWVPCNTRSHCSNNRKIISTK